MEAKIVTIDSKTLEGLRLETYDLIGSLSAFDTGRMFYYKNGWPSMGFIFDGNLSEREKESFKLGIMYESENRGFEDLKQTYGRNRKWQWPEVKRTS